MDEIKVPTIEEMPELLANAHARISELETVIAERLAPLENAVSDFFQRHMPHTVAYRAPVAEPTHADILAAK